MRRSFKDDPLYWACFSEYVQSMVSFGDHPLEFFVEGTRSRTGKSLHPKVGLFGVSLRPYFDCRAPDFTLVPISITYEERMEAQSYAKEMIGVPKTKESIGALVRARAVLEHSCGRMHVRVGPCLSVRDELEAKVSRQRHTESPGMTAYTDDERGAVEDLAYKVIATHQAAFVVTVPSVLAAVTLFWSAQKGAVSCVSVSTAVVACERVLRETRRRGHAIDVHPHGTDQPITTIRGARGATSVLPRRVMMEVVVFGWYFGSRLRTLAHAYDAVLLHAYTHTHTHTQSHSLSPPPPQVGCHKDSVGGLGH